MVIDTHCHLTDPQLNAQRDAALARAAKAGVVPVLTVGTDPADWAKATAFADGSENVYVAAGLHPHGARLADEQVFDELENVCRHAKVVALGEIGLDYHYDFSTPEQQRSAFARQLAMARRLQMPVVVHCRKAFDDAVRILDEHDMAGKPLVFHCFTGAAVQAKAVVERGWHVSFSGLVTFRSAVEVRQALAVVPSDRLLIETDSPYLTPEPIRKIRPNEPAHIVHTARCLAELRGVELAELARICNDNVHNLFGFPRPADCSVEHGADADGKQYDSRR